MRIPRYFILFRKEHNVVAAEAPPPTSDDWPASLSIQGTEYLPLCGEDTFFFWDELRDSAGATVGYTFMPPESPTFRACSLLRHSDNVCMDGEEVKILLELCSNPKWECVQGFGSEVYANKDDKTDCVLYIFDWSENRVAFPLYAVT